MKKNANEKYFVYLDKLRKSGKTNMFGAGPYLASEFSLEKAEARAIVIEWMRTFDKRHPEIGS